MRLAISSLIVLVLSTQLTPAHADRSPRKSAPKAEASADPEAAAKERARALLMEGNQKLADGLYLEALALFEQAYATFASPKIHFNLAQTYNELGRVLEALDQYERFLRGVPESEMPEQRALATRRVFELQGRTAAVTLQVNLAGATISADGNAVGSTPLADPLRFLPGAHVVLASKAGYQQQVIELDLRAGDATTRRVTLLTEAEALSQRREFQAAEAERRAAQQKLRREQAAGRERRQRTRSIVRTSGWITLSIGAAGALAASTFGGLSWYESDKVESAPTSWSWADDARPHYDRAQTYRTGFFASAILSAAGLGVGGGLLLYSRHLGNNEPAERSRAAIVPSLDGGVPGVMVGAPF